MSDAPAQARAAFDRYHARVAADPLDADPHLRALLQRSGHGDQLPAVQAFARRCATELDALAKETNLGPNLPRLERYDGFGNRTEEVVFHPGYHELGRAVYGSGVMQRYGTPGQESVTLALMYQLSQLGEAGHACPLACTAGLIKILGRALDEAAATGADTGPMAAWRERLLDPDYDSHFHGSQFLTEVQGGSDVGANAVIATPDKDGWWRITGEKWFCSVADAQLFLVTARPEDGREGTKGLMAFAVPRTLEDGRPNGFALRRLKDKLGTRSMASSEIDFTGARAWPVGDFRDVVSIVLNTSRLYNAAACCGIIQRAAREAAAYAAERTAFGAPILQFPAIARTVARLRAEAYAARVTTFTLAALADRQANGDADDLDRAAWRALVNLNKYWTSVQATTSARDAIEVLGGNGAIETFSVLPRLLRDGIVVEAWEGGHNVLCAQVLRDAQRLSLVEAMFTWLDRTLGGLSPELQHERARWQALVQRKDAAVYVRDLVDDLRGPLCAALLRQHADDAHDPCERAAADHVEQLSRRGYDPLADARLMERVAILVRQVD